VTHPDDPPLGDDEPDEPTAAEEATVDAASAAGVKRQRKRQRRAEDEAGDFWRAVFASPIGRREMWQILNADLHAFDTLFGASPNGAPDYYATWYRRGQQDVGLRLYQRWMALQPEAVILMHAENDPRFQKPKRKRNEPRENAE
jgi:hypothetical protein